MGANAAKSLSKRHIYSPFFMPCRSNNLIVRLFEHLAEKPNFLQGRRIIHPYPPAAIKNTSGSIRSSLKTENIFPQRTFNFSK